MSDVRKPVELSEEDKKQIQVYIQRLNEVSSGKSDLCIHCQKQFNELKQIGQCVYAYPCGCRQYQGTVPERWNPKKKLHPYLQEQLDQGLASAGDMIALFLEIATSQAGVRL